VERIAPERLVGRQQELAALAAFCQSSADDQRYQWWRAEAWSGKTALLSWFTLNPPSSVQIVSFFVTARYASQNDRAAFVDNSIEQLSALLNRELAYPVTSSTKENYFYWLLDEAAEACRSTGEHLVLLVDGLDEDRGVSVDAESHSIAALLPAHLPRGLRVLVAGRPNPPVPADVPEHHPLRDPTIRRNLSPSPNAEALRVEMERELRALLYGNSAQQDLLGFITASGGGLTSNDLADLTGLSLWQINDYLHTVTGRTFSLRDSKFSSGGPPRHSFVLGHEGLVALAHDAMGNTRIHNYQTRIRNWAQQYDDLQWPANTPEYLLIGYFSLLKGNSDYSTMVRLATNPARQDRLLEASGGDALGLSEIGSSIDAVSSQAPDDLTSMVRLAIHRDYLSDRNIRIPEELPAIWCGIGDLPRAEALTNSITDPYRRCRAAILLCQELVRIGLVSKAGQLVTQARIDFDTLVPHQQDSLRPPLMQVYLQMGKWDDAEGVAEAGVSKSEYSGYASFESFSSFADVLINLGYLERAEEVTLGKVHNPSQQVAHLTKLASAYEKAGDVSRSAEVIDQAIDIADTIEGVYQWCEAILLLARILARINQKERARALVESIEAEPVKLDNPYLRFDVATWMIGYWIEVGSIDEAAGIASALSPDKDIASLDVTLIRALVNSGHVTEAKSRAMQLYADIYSADKVDQHMLMPAIDGLVAAEEFVHALELITSIADEYQRRAILVHIISGMINAGQIEMAFRHIDDTDIDDIDLIRLLLPLSRAFLSTGEMGIARALASRIEGAARNPGGSYRRVEALTSLSLALSSAGFLERSSKALSSAASCARSESNPYSSGYALLEVVHTALSLKNYEFAQEIASATTNPQSQCSAYVALAEWLVESGRAADARTHMVLAEHTLVLIQPSPELVWLMIDLAHLRIDLGEPELAEAVVNRAEELLRAMYESTDRMYALVSVAEALIRLRFIDRAITLTDLVSDLSDRAYVRMLLTYTLIDQNELDTARDVIGTTRASLQSIDGDKSRDWTLVHIIKAIAHLGDIDNARSTVSLLGTLAQRSRALSGISEVLAKRDCMDSATEMLDEAHKCAAGITDEYERERELGIIAEEFAKAARPAQAEAIANLLKDVEQRSKVLLFACAASETWHAKLMLGEILQLVRWPSALSNMAHVAPEALIAASDEVDTPYSSRLQQ
jgi:tetratricopeptide (TPR) repeat protein